MNNNPAIQSPGVIAWDGAASTPFDVQRYNEYGFSFRVTTDVAVDAVFKLQSAPASAADVCVPDAFVDVDAFGSCQSPAEVGELAQVIIPAGTVAGTVCAASFPCRPNRFMQLVPVSGDTANVQVVAVLHGPRVAA